MRARHALALTALIVLGAAAVPAPTCHGPKYVLGTWDASTSTCDATLVCEQDEDVIIVRVVPFVEHCLVKYNCCTDPQL